MHLRYDEDFVEAAVRLRTSGPHQQVPSLLVARFHRERERLYDIRDPEERNAAFFRLHLEWFREWGLERLLTEPLNEFPLLPNALKVLAFRRSRGKNDEGTELYVTETGARTGVVAVRPEHLVRERGLGAFLRHELTHLHDMVDPAFGYFPELVDSGPFLNQHRLARERYRLLWDVSIDGRLSRRGCGTIATRDQRWWEFAGAFTAWTEAKQRDVFESLWTNPAPSHRVFLELVCDPCQLRAAPGPWPGAPCPLCGFPTFAWADASSLPHDTERAIQAEFPQWTLKQGACARCAAIFRSKPAPTICASPVPSTECF